MSWRRERIAVLGRERASEEFAAHERRYAHIHARLDAAAMLPPGPALAAQLASLADAQLDCSARIALAAQWARVASWVEAQTLRAWSDALDGGDSESDRLVAQELAVATRTSIGTALDRVALVRQMDAGLQPAIAELEAGRLSLAHLRALADATRALTDVDTVAAVVERAVPRATERGWTPAELRTAARRAVLALDPDGAARRHRAAAADSDVRLCREEDDMATLVATADAPTAERIMRHVEQAARELRRGGDQRPIGVLRVAALAHAVFSAGLDPRTGRTTAEVLVTVDMATLLGLAETPGELAGYGPINSTLARELARDGDLRRLVTDPVTGTPVDLGRTRYRPSASLRRILEARDPTCRFPGCLRPARACDIDHVTEWIEGGPTSAANLQPLCRLHHGFKTDQSWDAARSPDGATTWTSPLGRVMVKAPATYPPEGPDPPVPRSC
jgi:hypothetical protein